MGGGGGEEVSVECKHSSLLDVEHGALGLPVLLDCKDSCCSRGRLEELISGVPRPIPDPALTSGFDPDPPIDLDNPESFRLGWSVDDCRLFGPPAVQPSILELIEPTLSPRVSSAMCVCVYHGSKSVLSTMAHEVAPYLHY